MDTSSPHLQHPVRGRGITTVGKYFDVPGGLETVDWLVKYPPVLPVVIPSRYDPPLSLARGFPTPLAQQHHTALQIVSCLSPAVHTVRHRSSPVTGPQNPPLPPASSPLPFPTYRIFALSSIPFSPISFVHAPLPQIAHSEMRQCTASWQCRLAARRGRCRRPLNCGGVHASCIGALSDRSSQPIVARCHGKPALALGRLQYTAACSCGPGHTKVVLPSCP